MTGNCLGRVVNVNCKTKHDERITAAVHKHVNEASYQKLHCKTLTVLPLVQPSSIHHSLLLVLFPRAVIKNVNKFIAELEDNQTPSLKMAGHCRAFQFCVQTRARPIYWFSNVISQYWPIADILVSAHMLRYMPILKLFKSGKIAWTSHLKLCNQVICPAESGPSFDWK